MAQTAIIYLTDNSLDERLATVVRKRLLDSAGDTPIVSVSQRPVALGKNICVGEIGRSWDSLYKQLLAGIEALDTRFVHIAEHDCLYTPEHFQWEPPSDDTFYYNANCWLVQWGGNHPELNGMYSYWPRRLAMSQLVCNRELLKTAITERMELLGEGKSIRKEWLGCGEPGVISERAVLKAAKLAKSGRPVKLDEFLDKYLRKYTSKAFNNILPNLDIRHSSNFTGPKRGQKRCYSLPFWGEFATVMHG